MNQWEYRFAKGGLSELGLNRFGDEGWELVAVVGICDLVFKRPKGWHVHRSPADSIRIATPKNAGDTR